MNKSLIPYTKSGLFAHEVKNAIMGLSRGNPLKSCWRKIGFSHGLTPLLYIKDLAVGEGYYCVIVTAPLYDMKEGYPRFEMKLLTPGEIIEQWELIPFKEFAGEIINRLNNVFDFLF